MMDEKQKAILKHVKQPDGQQLKSVYVWVIVVLASAVVTLFTMWRVQISLDAKETKELNNKHAIDIAACNAEKLVMERNYSEKMISLVQDAKEDVIDRVMPEVSKREKRAAIITEQYSKIIPTQHRVKKVNNELNKELNKNPH